MSSPEDEVLDANLSFYRAFAERDFEQMDRLWAKTQVVACIHPGWHALFGRSDVMQSWEAILASDESPEVECSEATAIVNGETAVVVCTEDLGDTELVATNVFVKESGAWRLMHHQAGPFSRRLDPDEGPDETLN